MTGEVARGCEVWRSYGRGLYQSYAGDISGTSRHIPPAPRIVTRVGLGAVVESAMIPHRDTGRGTSTIARVQVRVGVYILRCPARIGSAWDDSAFGQRLTSDRATAAKKQEAIGKTQDDSYRFAQSFASGTLTKQAIGTEWEERCGQEDGLETSGGASRER